jgi:TM2 domain-containing membrane protein YozV
LSNFVNQTITSHSNRIVITEGRTFAFLSGTGGAGIHEQKLEEPWWAKVYTKTQHATYGALFGVFNVDGVPNKAMFYFKNIHGEVIDHFNVTSTIHNNLLHKENQQRKTHEIHS